jgi:hypothetical protein
MPADPPATAPPVYHPAVDRVLVRFLKSRTAVARLRHDAEAAEPDLPTQFLHAAALHLAERDIQLSRTIRHTRSDLEAVATELAEGRCAEHLLTGRGDQLAILAHRHRDALDRIETPAQLWARDRTENGEPAAR